MSRLKGESMVKITIKKDGTNTAILISFDTAGERFASASEKTKFFTELHGRKQVVTMEKKRYVYQRDGLLDQVPNIRVDNSVFIVAQEQMRRMEEFMKEWEDKVMFKTFPVLLSQEEVKKLKEQQTQTME